MAANTADLSDPDEALDLNNIRNALRRMEDSIIFSLVVRAQFLSDPPPPPRCAPPAIASRRRAEPKVAHSQNNAVYTPDHADLGPFKLHQLKSAGCVHFPLGTLSRTHAAFWV